MEFDSKHDGSRWVAYFDLLGITRLICEKRYVDVIHAYQQAITHLDSPRSKNAKINHTWFSDTFVIATTDDSISSFARIEQISRLFAYFLILKKIPLRGAIACGHMYADFDNRIFIGESLVEAYQYGEAQDWVGFVLCPSAMAAMERLDLPAESRLNYSLWNPHWSKPAPAGAPMQLAACLLGSGGQLNGENLVRTSLQEMAVACGVDKVRAKYERAIEFIDCNPRRVAGDC